MQRRTLTANWIQIILHILSWTILIIIPLYLASRYGASRKFFRIFFLKDMIIMAILFYFNYLVLVPRLLFKGKRLRYTILVLALLISFYFLSYFPHEYMARKPDMEQKVEPEREGSREQRTGFRIFHAYNYTLTSVAIIFLSLGLGSLKRQSQIEKRQEELEKEKLNSELAFLKNQISPHFFFNTLNNIYSLIEIDKEQSKDAVFTLSRLMRYLLYDTEKGETRLCDEIDFMNHYIDLMKLRLTDKVMLNVTFPENDENITIPPLLFIPFIENAFKHGISNRERSEIGISLQVLQKVLTFDCKNRITRTKNGTSDLTGSGIGLENAIKRLNLLFPDNHTLKISQAEDFFEVHLEIRFKQTA